MSKIVAIIQARTGSSRLPAKMLMKLSGKPILHWVIHRTLKSEFVDQIVLATTTNPKDDPIEMIGKEFGIEVFRGSENDVLSRYYEVALNVKADTIVRICADNPFIAPEEIDRLIKYYKTNAFDYAFNHIDDLGNSYADGFGAEIFSLPVLKYLHQTMFSSNDKEHVSLALREKRTAFSISTFNAPQSLRYPDLKFDLDTIEDLRWLERLVSSGVKIDTSANEIVRVALELANKQK